mgnify:CR=1 FL=1
MSSAGGGAEGGGGFIFCCSLRSDSLRIIQELNEVSVAKMFNGRAVRFRRPFRREGGDS